MDAAILTKTLLYTNINFISNKNCYFFMSYNFKSVFSSYLSWLIFTQYISISTSFTNKYHMYEKRNTHIVDKHTHH